MTSGNGTPIEKNMKLLSAVVSHITVHPNKFVAVVNVFEEEPTLAETTGKLVETQS